MNILMAVKYPIIRKGLKQVLHEQYPSTQFQFTEVLTGVDAFAKARNVLWNLIILDIDIEGIHSLDILKQLKAEDIQGPVLVMSARVEENFSIRLIKAGASAFFHKADSVAELVTALREIIAGGTYISSVLANKLIFRSFETDDKPVHELLSDRELQIMQFIAHGKTPKEIAGEIFLSVYTVSTYRARALAKLGLRNNAELTRYALDNDLV